MPELPEVETVKNDLLPHIIGRRITAVTLVWEGIVKEPSVAEFHRRINNNEIMAMERHGKYLIVTLSSDDLLIIHLKMTGSLILGEDSSEPPRFTRAIIHLDDGTSIFFRDPRKFGILKLVKDTVDIDRKLGPEPLEDDFTVDVFAERLAKRTAPIKALLLDQKFVAGIGNMYADESLYAARINPRKESGKLTREEIERLYYEIRRILWAAIENKGASVATYYRPDGSEGTAHYHFNVAHGQGKTCPVCGGPIERIVIRNRGTYYCPVCQAPD